MAENHRLTKDGIGDHLIVPNCHLDELGKRSDAEIDVQEAFEKVNTPTVHLYSTLLTVSPQTFENKHVRLFPSRDKSSIVNNVVKSDLNRNLGEYFTFLSYIPMY